MINKLKNFLKAEEGAVTVDWVVLTTAIIATTIVITALVGPKIIEASGVLSSNISAKVDELPPLPGSD